VRWCVGEPLAVRESLWPRRGRISAFVPGGTGFAAGVNTFDRHLLREWLQMLGLVLAATCGLLLVVVLYEDFRDLRQLGAQGGAVGRYLLVKLPSFLTIVLPLALLVSLLYVLGRLHRANELTAMRAAGVSFTRMTAPIWVVGLLACGASWWLNTTLVPWSVEESRQFQDELQFQQQTAKALPTDHIGAVYNVAFDNPEKRRMWFFNRYSKKTNRGYGVSVSELDALRREVRRYNAAEAWRDEQRQGWVFRNGRELLFAPESGEMIGSRPFEERFEAGYNEDPDLMLLIDAKPSHLSLPELRRLLNQLELERSPKVARYAVRYFGVMAEAVTPLVVIALAIPFSITGVRVNAAVGVSKSIGLFFLYYLFTNFSVSLASRNLLDPLLAAWLPHGAMLALAIWLFTRVR
jgi:lipopolysaccharide export system permease protein